MNINNSSKDITQEGYYNKKFRYVIEANLKNIKQNTSTSKLFYDDNDMNIYNGDLYRYLKFKSVSNNLDMYWVIMRVSGFNSPHDFGKNTRSYIKDPFTNKVYMSNVNNYLLIPNKKVIEDLYSQFSISQNETI